jgi:hypothetical protein
MSQTLKGVVIPLSKVMTKRVGNRLYILRCDCLQRGHETNPSLWQRDGDAYDDKRKCIGLDGIYAMGCPVCGYYYWTIGEASL